jgi:general L-amino acid transport system permease protein
MSESLTVTNARPAPVHNTSAFGWLRANLFSGWKSTLVTLAILWLAISIVPELYRWAFGNAVFTPDFSACRAVAPEGACWGMIAEKSRLILFGRYPYLEQWRPLIATLVMIAALIVSCFPKFWRKWLVPLWVAALAVFFVLMRGGLFGLTYVETNLWGGFPLTLMLTVVGLFFALPLAVLIALGRRSRLKAIRAFCVFYVEIIRGIPLITVLFTASFLFPLFLPPQYNIDVLLRIQIGIILFTAAYLAETIRGGLQAIPKGQYEAAAAMGLGYWQTVRKIVLPQALRIVVAPMVNTFIGTFMDTSLVTVVSLYDLTGALRLALGDPNWKAFFIEGYLFIAAIYLVCCYGMSRYSQWIEKRISRRQAR